MEKTIRYRLDTIKFKAVNSCHTYLQIMTMAEMTNIEGTHIIREAYYGMEDKNGDCIQRYSRSVILWPT
jgi:hypothetical protein